MTLKKSFRASWRACKWGIRRNGIKFLSIWLAFCVITALFIWRYDEQVVLQASRFGSGWFTVERLHSAARLIHKYGDFVFFNVILASILIVIGKVRNNSYFTRIATTLFLAGVVSGLSVQVIKFTAGRPRPPLVQKGKTTAWSFAGPTLSAKHRSYPSGHSACVATAATVLALALPRLLPLAAIAAIVVGGSRIVYNYHFPTDVLHGLAYGMAVGGMCASHLVALRRRLVRMGQWPSGG